MIREYLKKYSDDINSCMNDLKNIKTWYKQIPNLLTVSRPIGIIPANILFFTGHVIPAIILTALLLLTDLFDGKLARKWNVQSKLGADLDAVGDKITFLGLSLPLMISNPLLIINLFLEGVVSGINVLGRLKGLDTKTIYFGKIKMWFLSLTLIIGYFTYFFDTMTSILGLAIGVTSLWQLVVVKDYVTEFIKMNNVSKVGLNELNKIDDILDKHVEMKRNRDREYTSSLSDESIKELTLDVSDDDNLHLGKKRVRKLMQDKRTLFK